MNIQIFGTKKCNETKKAERFFKERGIKYQFIDMKEKGMSKGASGVWRFCASCCRQRGSKVTFDTGTLP